MPTLDPMPTRPSLLLRVRDPRDRDAWETFFGLYAPLIHRFAKRGGFQDADAADIVQDVLRSVAREMSRLDYDRTRGSFRSWLYIVTRNALANARERRNSRHWASGGPEVQARLDAEPAPPTIEEASWTREYRLRRLAWAAERARPRFEPNTWQAFWRTAVEGEAAKTVAEALGLSVGAVHVAKSRVISRLKQEIASLDDEEG